MQRSAGLYGAMIVDVAEGEKEPFHYDGEFDLLLSDWWHKSVHHQEVGLSSRPMRWINEPQVDIHHPCFYHEDYIMAKILYFDDIFHKTLIQRDISKHHIVYTNHYLNFGV
jgi:hypothetical protein